MVTTAVAFMGCMGFAVLGVACGYHYSQHKLKQQLIQAINQKKEHERIKSNT